MDRNAKHIIFVGRVQGVGFRYTARQIAQRYALSGYVKNLPDGTVEMLAQGPLQDVDAYIADVQDVFAGSIRETHVEDAPYNSRYGDFQVAF